MPCLLQSFVKILTALFHVCMLSDENNPSLVERPVTKSVCAKRVREVKCSCVTKRLPAPGRVDRGVSLVWKGRGDGNACEKIKTKNSWRIPIWIKREELTGNWSSSRQSNLVPRFSLLPVLCVLYFGAVDLDLIDPMYCTHEELVPLMITMR